MEPITQKEFIKIRDLLELVCGIALQDDQEYLVETRLSELGETLDAETFSELHRIIVAKPDEYIPKVIDLMTTNETLWFRDNSCWNTLENKIMPEFFRQLDQSSRNIKIWSLACSTGQEPYSLAMLIEEMAKKRGRPSLVSRFDILATDISNSALSIAKEALYDPFSIKRGLSEERKIQFFSIKDGKWKLHDEIRQRVKFKFFNVMDSFSELGTFDLILARNIAIYFTPSFKREFFDRLAKSLNHSGFILLGSSESLIGIPTPFSSTSFESGVYYQVLS